MPEEGGKSMYIIHLEFEQCDHSDNDVKKKQRWKHKLTDRSFWVYRTPNGTTWETGIWNKELLSISQGRKSAKHNIKAIERATRILDIRGHKPTMKKRDVGPTKDCGFYPFEENLPHHIREAYVVISTGSTISFFTNPYVIDWLKHLNPAHCPIYRLKFLCLLRVIHFVLNCEIGLMLKERFLKYHCSFVASTSYFYCDNVRKASFGACIANFMAKQYRFKTDISLFMSDATLQSLSEKWEHSLKSKVFKINVVNPCLTLFYLMRITLVIFLDHG